MANKYNLPASARVPPIALPFISERALKTLDVVRKRTSTVTVRIYNS
jgi:hypothetical protein